MSHVLGYPFFFFFLNLNIPTEKICTFLGSQNGLILAYIFEFTFKQVGLFLSNDPCGVGSVQFVQ